MIISEWSSRAELDRWREGTTAAWELHLVQTFTRNVAINLLASFIIPAVLRLVAILKREHVDISQVSQPVAEDARAGPNSFTATRLHGLADEVE